MLISRWRRWPAKARKSAARSRRLAQIIDKVQRNDRLTVCLDTCHVHDAGYDIVNDLDGVLEEFDRIIGLERMAVVHLNDSKNPRGAGKDRHAPVGVGLDRLRGDQTRRLS